MNYATDRLDRKHRGNDLYKDYVDAIDRKNHTLLAQTLRDVGWNRQAIFHYGQAWMVAAASSSKDDDVGVSNYAQMVELAGFSEVGLVALLHYRLGGPLKAASASEWAAASTSSRDASWLQQTRPLVNCGCGLFDCGKSPCFIPMANVDPTLACLESACLSVANEEKKQSPMTAHKVLALQAKGLLKDMPIPLPLEIQVWKQTENLRALSLVSQLLFLKLVYLTLPSLACNLVVYTPDDLHDNQEPAAPTTASYKSHWAYFTLVCAVVLGERIKRTRRFTLPHYHVPIWDRIHALDWRRDYTYSFQPLQETCPYNNALWISTVRGMLLEESCEAIKPISPILPTTLTNSGVQLLYLVGDSHVLSLAWQEIRLPTASFLIVPVVVTGLKAWHCRPETRFFTRTCLDTMLERIPHARTIVLSVGEIDCREGLGGPKLEGYQEMFFDQIESTVDQLIDSLRLLLSESSSSLEQILLMPVPPHGHRATGRVAGQVVRRQTTCHWNECLRRRLPRDGIFLLDYAKDLIIDDDGSSYILKPALDADSTHMNAGFARHFEKAMAECGCSLELLRINP